MTSLYKDANECLLAGLDADAMRACLNASQEFAPEKVKSAESFRAAFMAEWFDKELESGLSLPFPFPWKVRNSELTVWTGIEKSGKTTLLQFVLAGLLHQGERALIASFELKAAKNLKKFSRQVYGGLIRNPKLEDKCLNEEQRQN
jgi:twinkle protein